MLNNLLKLYNRPESGWDPLTPEYATKYSSTVSDNMVQETISYIQSHLGNLHGLKVLDLGAGPGLFSKAFIEQGCDVCWYDISKTYMELAQAKIGNNEQISYQIGYLDDAPNLLKEQFDLVFNRVCWYYSVSDRSFLRNMDKLVHDGGHIFVETNNSSCRKNSLKLQIQNFLYHKLSLKLGHPYPKHGKIESLFRSKNYRMIDIDYSRDGFDRLLAQKQVLCQIVKGK